MCCVNISSVLIILYLISLYHFNFRLQEYPRKDGFKSKLVIRPVTESDFGDYNCTVQNSHGVDSYIITLKEERKYFISCLISAQSRIICQLTFSCSFENWTVFVRFEVNTHQYFSENKH